MLPHGVTPVPPPTMPLVTASQGPEPIRITIGYRIIRDVILFVSTFINLQPNMVQPDAPASMVLSPTASSAAVPASRRVAT